MHYFLAIIEDAGPNRAVGVWFPDIPGCFAAGDDFDDAQKAPKILASHMNALQAKRLPVPRARRIYELRRDPSIAAEISKFIVAAISYDDAVITK